MDFAAAADALSSAPWLLGQAWRASPQESFRPGTVFLGWRPDALWVLAGLDDDHVVSRSTGHGQDMWTLGDVFEVFIARRGSPWYLELHVTPNNHRLHLRWTAEDFSAVRGGGRAAADFRAAPGAFDSRARRTPGGTGWQALLRIPAAVVPAGAAWSAGEELELSFSRYDTGPEGSPEILSSTSPHTAADYHRRSEWRPARLAAGSGADGLSRADLQGGSVIPPSMS